MPTQAPQAGDDCTDALGPEQPIPGRLTGGASVGQPRRVGQGTCGVPRDVHCHPCAERGIMGPQSDGVE